MKKLVTGAFCGVFLIAGNGCGNDIGGTTKGNLDELSGEGAEYSESLANAMTEQQDAPLTSTEASCWSTRLVSGFGVERLEEVGLTPKAFATKAGPSDLNALSESERDTFAKGFSECIDLVDLVMREASMDGEVAPEMEQCFRDSMTQESELAFAQALIVGSQDTEGDSDMGTVMAPMLDCIFMGFDDSGMEVDTSGGDTSTTMSG